MSEENINEEYTDIELDLTDDTIASIAMLAYRMLGNITEPCSVSSMSGLNEIATKYANGGVSELDLDIEDVEVAIGKVVINHIIVKSLTEVMENGETLPVLEDKTDSSSDK